MFRQSVLIVPMLTSDIVCISFLLRGHQCRCIVKENKNNKKKGIMSARDSCVDTTQQIEHR